MQKCQTYSLIQSHVINNIFIMHPYRILTYRIKSCSSRHHQSSGVASLNKVAGHNLGPPSGQSLAVKDFHQNYQLQYLATFMIKDLMHPLVTSLYSHYSLLQLKCIITQQILQLHVFMIIYTSHCSCSLSQLWLTTIHVCTTSYLYPCTTGYQYIILYIITLYCCKSNCKTSFLLMIHHVTKTLLLDTPFKSA